MYYFDEARVLLGYTILLFLTIPAKKALDWPRRRRIQRITQNGQREGNGLEVDDSSESAVTHNGYI